MNLSWYVHKANVDHTINGQGTAISTLDLAEDPLTILDYSDTTRRAK